MKIWWFLMLTTLLASGILCIKESSQNLKPRRTRTHAITDIKNSHQVLPSIVTSSTTERSATLKFGEPLRTKVKQDYQQIKDYYVQGTDSEPSVQSTTPRTTVSVKSSTRTLSRSQVISANADAGKSSRATLHQFFQDNRPQTSKTNDRLNVKKVVLSQSETATRRVPKSTYTQPPPALIPTSSPCPIVKLTTPRLTVTTASRTLISPPVDNSHQKQRGKASEWIVIRGDTATAATSPKTYKYVPLRVTTKSPNVQNLQSHYVTSTTPNPINHGSQQLLCPCLTASTPKQDTTRQHVTVTQTPQVYIPVTQTPKVHIPVTQTPQVYIPVTQTPKVHIPVTQTPQVYIPVTHVPQIKIPVTQVSQPKIPVTQVPQIKISVTTPTQVNIPKSPPPLAYVSASPPPRTYVSTTPPPRTYVQTTPSTNIYVPTRIPVSIYTSSTPPPKMYVSTTPSQQVYISTTQNPRIYTSTTYSSQTHAPSTKPPVRTKTVVKDTVDTVRPQQVPSTRHRRPPPRPTTQTSIFDEQIPVRSGHKSIEAPIHWLGDPAYQIYTQYHDIKRVNPVQTNRKPPASSSSRTTSVVLNQYQTTTQQPTTYRPQEVISVTIKQPSPTTYRPHPQQTYTPAYVTTVKPIPVRVTTASPVSYHPNTLQVLRVSHSSTTASPKPAKPRPPPVVNQQATLPEYTAVTTVKTPPQQKDWSDDSYTQAVHNFHFESFKDKQPTISKTQLDVVPVHHAPAKQYTPVVVSKPQIVSTTMTPIQVHVQYPQQQIHVEQKKPALEQFHYELDIRQQQRPVQAVLQQTISSSTPSPPLTVTPHSNYASKHANVVIPNVQILVPQYHQPKTPTIINLPPPPTRPPPPPPTQTLPPAPTRPPPPPPTRPPPPPPTRPPPPPPTRPPPPPPTRPPPPPPTRPPPPPPTRPTHPPPTKYPPPPPRQTTPVPQQFIDTSKVALHQYQNYEIHKVQQYPKQIIPILISQSRPSTTVKPIVSVPVTQTVLIQQQKHQPSPPPTIHIPLVSYATTKAPAPAPAPQPTQKQTSHTSHGIVEQYQYNIAIAPQQHVKTVSAVLPQVSIQQQQQPPIQTVHIQKPLPPKPQQVHVQQPQVFVQQQQAVHVQKPHPPKIQQVYVQQQQPQIYVQQQQPQIYVQHQQPVHTVHIQKPHPPKVQPKVNIVVPVSPMHIQVSTPQTTTLPCPVEHVKHNVSPIPQLFLNVTPLPPQTTKHVLIHNKKTTKEQKPVTEAPRLHSTITAVLSQNEYAKPIQQVAVNLGTSETKPSPPSPPPPPPIQQANNVAIPQWPPIPNTEWRGDSVSHVVHQSHVYPVLKLPGAPPVEPPPGYSTNKGHTNIFTQYSVNHQHHQEQQRVISQVSHSKVNENNDKKKHADESDKMQDNLVPPTPTIVFFPMAPVAPQTYDPRNQAYNPHLIAAATLNQVFQQVPYQPQIQSRYDNSREVQYIDRSAQSESDEEAEDENEDTYY